MITMKADPASKLADGANACASYADHGAACSVAVSKVRVPTLADWLEAHWRRFVGADFQPE